MKRVLAAFFFGLFSWANTQAPPSAVRTNIVRCVELLTELKARFEARGRALPLEPSRLERRLLRFSLGARLPFEFPFHDVLTDHRLSNIRKSLLEQLQRELREDGGHLVFTLLPACYFRLNDDARPLIGLRAFAEEKDVEHELKHLVSWRQEMRDRMRAGMPRFRAARSANELMRGPRGAFIDENRAKAAELIRLVEMLSEALRADVTEVERETPMGRLAIPLEVYANWEGLIQHAAYPFTEALEKIDSFKERLGHWTWRLGSWKKARRTLLGELDALEETLSRELAEEVLALKQQIVAEQLRLAAEARSRDEADAARFHLASAREVDAISFRAILVNSLRGDSPLWDRVESAIESAKVRQMPSTKLTADEQDQIERSLARVARSEGPAHRYDRSGSRVVREFEYQGIFIESDGSDHLDLEALRFEGAKEFVSQSRHRTFLRAPIVESDEIRRRQGAVRELLDPWLLFSSRLESIFASAESRHWRGNLYREYDTEPNLTRDLNSGHFGVYGSRYREILKRSLSKRVGHFFGWQDDTPVEMLEHMLRSIREFFREIGKVRVALHGAESMRLRQLKWIFDACFDPHHPYGIASDVAGVLKEGPLEQSYEALYRLLDGKPKVVQRLEEAYGELALMFDIASNARARGWSVFPTILDRDTHAGPVLRVTDLHNIRVQKDSPDRSVSNSISMGGENGKHFVLNGPNAQGKSTFQRTVGHFVILAQMGSPVPAKAGELTPLSLIVHVHPTDNPRERMSLLMAEGKALMGRVYANAKRDAFSLSLMDEVLPGTIPEVREDVETEFLQALAGTGGLSIVATHNWGTTSLGGGSASSSVGTMGQGLRMHEERASPFRNIHVDHFRVLPGPTSDLASMYEAAIEALRSVGWPEAILERIRVRGHERMERLKSSN